MPTKTKGWSAERRRRQAEAIRQIKPWENATGPRSEAGKSAACRNARTHGLRTAEIQLLRKLLKQQAAYLKRVKGGYL